MRRNRRNFSRIKEGEKIAGELVKAKKLCRLNDNDVRMARELGMTPRVAIKNRPNRREPWKTLVKD